MSGSFSYDQSPLYRDYAVCCTQRKETKSLCVSGTQEHIEEMFRRAREAVYKRALWQLRLTPAE
jgi:hypothetical protein